MEISASAQGMAILFSCAVGALLAAFYGALKIARIAFGANTAVLFVQDFCYCIFSAFVIILLVYHTNYGQVRWYGLLGCAVGFYVYHVTVGKLAVLAAEKIIALIKKLLAFLYSISVKPLINLVKFAAKVIGVLLAKIHKTAYRGIKSIEYRVRLRRIKKETRRGFGFI